MTARAARAESGAIKMLAAMVLLGCGEPADAGGDEDETLEPFRISQSIRRGDYAILGRGLEIYRVAAATIFLVVAP